MHIESEDRLDRPVSDVYPLVRDRLPELLPYLPDVEQIVESSRERTSETRVSVINQWKAKPKVPGMVAKFVPPEVFGWKDTALWKDDETTVEYRLEGFGYEVDGTTEFVPDGEGTTIRVTATVTIHPETFKIPRLVFKKVFPLLEGTIKKAVQPNLTALARGLRAYFADQG